MLKLDDWVNLFLGGLMLMVLLRKSPDLRSPEVSISVLHLYLVLLYRPHLACFSRNFISLY